MKKLLLTIALVAAMIFTGCEKDQEEPQQLSEFVIGDWISQTVLMGSDGDIYFTVTIEPTSYTLRMTDGTLTIDLGPAHYSVDNDDNSITIDQPALPGETPTNEKVTFDVSWKEGESTMTWLPVIGGGTEPTLIWTRQ